MIRTLRSDVERDGVEDGLVLVGVVNKASLLERDNVHESCRLELSEREAERRCASAELPKD